MPITRRPQPAHIKWPFTPATADAIEKCFRTLFKDMEASDAINDIGDADTGAFFRFNGTAGAWSSLLLPNAATIGDIPYASAANTLSMLAGVATGNALISGGVATAPSWGKIGLTTHVSGVLPIANGGTNNSSAYTAGSVIYSNGTSLTQDNSGLFFDASTDRLGIGVASPQHALDVRAVSPILAGYHSDTAGFASLRFFEGTTLRSAVQHIGTTFATAGRRDDLEFVTLQNTGDIAFRPNDTETARFLVGGGLQVTELTTGSVLFAAASGRISQDNTNLFWDDTNNWLGVGTAAPERVLHTKGDAILIERNANIPAVLFRNTLNGTISSYIGLRNTGASAGAVEIADETSTATIHIVGTNVGIGSDQTPDAKLVLRQVDGATALRVTDQGANARLALNGNSDGTFTWYDYKTGSAVAGISQGNGVVAIGTTAWPTTGTAGLIFGDGTALATMGSNTAGFYAEDVSGTVKMFGITEAGVTGELAMNAAALTAGSIPFAGATGLLTQDNANLFWDDTNNRLGIGGVPDVQLHIRGNNGTFSMTATVDSAVYQNIKNGGGADLYIGVENAAGGALFVGGVGDAGGIGLQGADPLIFATTNTVRMTLSAVGNLLIGPGATAFPSTGTAGLVFADGTALATMGTNTAGIYAENVGTTVQMHGIHEDGTTGVLGLVVTKTDTGDPTAHEGLFVINTFDNTFKVYADGAWRTLASGW